MGEDSEAALVPTSGVAFKDQVLVLRAYVVLSDFGNKPVHYKRVMKATGLARTQISGVNSFFVGMGFMKKVAKGTYSPSTEIVNFYSEVPGSEDYSALIPLLRNSNLYELIRSAIMIHGGVTEDELIDILLRESGEKARSRAKRALQWLEKTGLIRTDESGNTHFMDSD